MLFPLKRWTSGGADLVLRARLIVSKFVRKRSGHISSHLGGYGTT